ncbi:MAG: hypothetical protein CSA62_13160 [Planctomycetota bacterium]|nr:MAG: hypothetical protein CSA62_13160 [Planctomycetota bacterium]
MKIQLLSLGLLLALAAPLLTQNKAAKSLVRSGLDVLVDEDFRRLEGRKVGLITNHTGIDREGRQNVDLFYGSKRFQLVALFGPEHGIRGEFDQPEVPSGKDAKTGLPVFSLYGKDPQSRKPSAEHLKGLDTLVFDIQDIGTRFYTYISTMALAMESAAEHGLRFVVLDRPNPIGGELVEGPVLDQGKESFVGAWTLPVRHGMTCAELALMLRKEKDLDLDLQVVALRGWKRSMYFEETGLYWVNPSPNMRNMHEALLYPGIGLLEFTNLSVGRGTDTPFERIGAPWLDGRSLADRLMARRLPGVVFQPLLFQPKSSKFAGRLCNGIAILVTDRARFRPLRTGIEIAVLLRQLHPEDWKAERYQRLLADAATYEAVLAAQDPEKIQELWAAELESFLARRKRFLLYD